MPADAMTGQYAQQQKMLLYVLPVVFAVGGIAFPIGVLFYWTTSNLWTMCQQFYVIRNNPAPGTPAAKAKQERDAAKRERKGLPDPATPIEPTRRAVSTAPERRRSASSRRSRPAASAARRPPPGRQGAVEHRAGEAPASATTTRNPAATAPDPSRSSRRAGRPHSADRAAPEDRSTRVTEQSTSARPSGRPDAERVDDQDGDVRSRRPDAADGAPRDEAGRRRADGDGDDDGAEADDAPRVPATTVPERPRPPGERGRHRRGLPRGAPRHRRPRRRPGHGRRGRPRLGQHRRRRRAASSSGATARCSRRCRS